MGNEVLGGENRLSSRTVGLVSVDEFRREREALEAEKAVEAGMAKSKGISSSSSNSNGNSNGNSMGSKKRSGTGESGKRRKKKRREGKGNTNDLLSFADTEDDILGTIAPVLTNHSEISSSDNNNNNDDDDDDNNDSKNVRNVKNGDDAGSIDTNNDKNNKSDKNNDRVNEETAVVSSITKDPTVDTAFLPDRERDEREYAERLRLKEEWLESQRRIKAEPLDITYSFWDGSGHRRTIRVKKGDTVGEFLRQCLRDLTKEFRDLRYVSVDGLIYVKEDLILPHHYTFYEFIITKARGKSGPLFSFGVKDDVRLLADATVEKEETHAGKVLTRSYYDKHKHQFPYSRWTVFDPAVKYEKYTIK